MKNFQNQCCSGTRQLGNYVTVNIDKTSFLGNFSPLWLQRIRHCHCALTNAYWRLWLWWRQECQHYTEKCFLILPETVYTSHQILSHSRAAVADERKEDDGRTSNHHSLLLPDPGSHPLLLGGILQRELHQHAPQWFLQHFRWRWLWVSSCDVVSKSCMDICSHECNSEMLLWTTMIWWSNMMLRIWTRECTNKRRTIRSRARSQVSSIF